ncbi:MAG TPA: hypothetical protein VND93_02060 [Myxococcales bacterium]|jgi:hypothetical protein|nr:hypothetical protein [Myxococcales bacterium]
MDELPPVGVGDAGFTPPVDAAPPAAPAAEPEAAPAAPAAPADSFTAASDAAAQPAQRDQGDQFSSVVGRDRLALALSQPPGPPPPGYEQTQPAWRYGPNGFSPRGTEVWSQPPGGPSTRRFDPNSEQQVDGYFLGANGVRAPVGDFRTMSPITPSDRSEYDRSCTVPTLVVNGILNDTAGQRQLAQNVADRTGTGVVGVRNSTFGAVPDVGEAAGEKLLNLQPPAAHSLANVLEREALQGNMLNIHAHSQGGLITSSAVEMARDRLVNQHGFTPEQAEQRLNNFTIHTYGAASRSYPDGPQYYHHINNNDPVATVTGLGMERDYARQRVTHPGRGAQFEYMNYWGGGNPHSAEAYLRSSRLGLPIRP